MRKVTEFGLRAVLHRLRKGNVGYAGFTNLEQTAQFSLCIYKCRRHGDPYENASVISILVNLEDSDSGVGHWIDACFSGDTEMYEYGPVDEDFRDIETGKEIWPDVYRRVTQLQDMRVCPCNRNVYFDSADMCMSCHLTCSEADLKKEFCSVCQEDVLLRHAVTVDCCSNFLHRSCYENCVYSTSSLKCPVCRGRCVLKHDN